MTNILEDTGEGNKASERDKYFPPPSDDVETEFKEVMKSSESRTISAFSCFKHTIFILSVSPFSTGIDWYAVNKQAYMAYKSRLNIIICVCETLIHVFS